jgi:hypothetical protein
MRKLKVDLAELAMAFEDHSFDVTHFLDLETGKVIFIDPETQFAAAYLSEEMDTDEDGLPISEDEALDQREYSAGLKEAAREAAEVEAGLGTRYLAVPHVDSHEGYRDMEEFLATVTDARLADRLARAIQGRGPFRRFKDVLAYDPGERERWFRFKDARMQQRVMDWLESEDIEAEAEPATWPAPRPPTRLRLIAEVLAFTRAARQLPGVSRIALIGSLTTEKLEPKDADLLVTVADDADLTALATLGRRLQGHAQQFNRGGDVFLADPAANYIGRTCHWKDCRPGIRQSCDALHCGQRHYLHDDLGSVRLKKELVAAPPVELWPQVTARVPVPEDVEQGLLGPLRLEG